MREYSLTKRSFGGWEIWVDGTHYGWVVRNEYPKEEWQKWSSYVMQSYEIGHGRFVGYSESRRDAVIEVLINYRSN